MVALGALWRHRRLKRGFSEVRPLGPRPFENRGGPKWLETDSVGPPGFPENPGGGVALQILLDSRGVLTILGVSLKGPAGAPKIQRG